MLKDNDADMSPGKVLGFFLTKLKDRNINTATKHLRLCRVFI